MASAAKARVQADGLQVADNRPQYGPEPNPVREGYLRRILTGAVTCETQAERAEAVDRFRADLWPGRRVWVNGVPVELRRRMDWDDGSTGIKEKWVVRQLYVADTEEVEMVIKGGARLSQCHGTAR